MNPLQRNLHQADPLQMVGQWLDKARETEPNDADAIALATVNAAGQPSVRMVLMREIDDKGFCFYTNTESRKGQDLKVNAAAAFCFYWKSLGQQIRVEGEAERLPPARTEAYFARRPAQSRLGAWASAQSRPLESREVLLEKVAAAEKKYGLTDIPCPPYWGGYRVIPRTIEFWQTGDYRLHDRFLFTRDAAAPTGWRLQRLYP